MAVTAVSGADGSQRRPGPTKVDQVNLRDVAKRAGVSVATASRVLADSPHVSDGTRQRVMKAAEQLGYVRNGLVRAMTGHGPRTIALIFERMIGTSFAQLAGGAEQVAGARGHLLFISSTEGSLERESRLISVLAEQRVAAVLMVGATRSSGSFERTLGRYCEELASVGAPLILCGRRPIATRPEIVSVDYDHAGGIARAVDHLVAQGHRRIGYLGEGVGTTTSEVRLSGYRAAMRSHGLRPHDELIVTAGNSAEEGAVAMNAFLDSGVEATAFVSMTDNLAVGVYRAARCHGLRIGHDLSVVGFDANPLTGDLTPGLTSVRAPFRLVGQRAVEIALGIRPKENVVFPTELVAGGSVGSLAG
ncbi:LacI family transcriptional regulator [Propionibacterium cyclohexanicum]|uniref:LacI family transcriptional regulator n=1 Tax=Propionibacterium cyclohexanicum TaxID=64702 RepID=A0A1H9S9F6_9ACTN|nr:LacI family DNA-binding transcriptional regulator [Propionibacterium cyclohexanicum]SER81640.1 LacI family transcriptional regulator [Propionibacterium cyclohexanicum]